MKLTNNWEGKNYMKYNRDLKTGQFKNKVKSFLKKLLFWIIVIFIFAGVIQYFRWAYPTKIEVIKEVMVEKTPTYPVLDRIAQCESGGSHLGKNGQVVVNGNTNGSVDVGLYQINDRLWGKAASDMGYNLSIEKDNRAFAIYLYTTQGTEPWIWSKKCWNK